MLALKQIRWNRLCLALIVCLLLPLSALALELRADSVTPFAENTITVISDTAGELTISASCGGVTLEPPASGLWVEAGTTKISWSALSWGGEPLREGTAALYATLSGSDGQKARAQLDVQVKKPLSAVVCCLPVADAYYPGSQDKLRVEIGMSAPGGYVLSVAAADAPDRVLWQRSGSNEENFPAAMYWDGRTNGGQACAPGEYVLTAWSTRVPEVRQSHPLTILSAPPQVPALSVTGPLLPADLSDDEAVWAALTAPIAVGEGYEGNGLYIHAQKSSNAEVVGTCSCRTVGLTVLEIGGDGWVRVGVWRQQDNIYVEGYVRRDEVRVIQPSTRYGAVVDKRAQTMTIYEAGKPIGTMLVSTGLVTPDTPRGETNSGAYLIGTRMAAFINSGSSYSYPLRIDGSNLIHQLGWNRSSAGRGFEAEIAELGHKASHGCIRMDARVTEECNGINAWWVWTHLGRDTKVLVTEDGSNPLIRR